MEESGYGVWKNQRGGYIIDACKCTKPANEDNDVSIIMFTPKRQQIDGIDAIDSTDEKNRCSP